MSDSHQKAMELKNNETISGFKVIKKILEGSESVDLFDLLKQTFENDFSGITYEFGSSPLTNDNAEFILDLTGAVVHE